MFFLDNFNYLKKFLGTLILEKLQLLVFDMLAIFC